METRHGHRLSRRALCCGGAALFCCLPALRAQAQKLESNPLHLVEAAPGLYVSQGVHEEASRENLGAIANCGFIVGEERVAVIDTGGCRLWGQRLREAIRRVTDRPITHVILTHMHPDHVFGSIAFRDDQPDFVGHAKLRPALASRQSYYERRLGEALGEFAAGSTLVMPTLDVHDYSEIDLGGRVLGITAHTTAHTDNDLSILDAKTRTLWAGDLLFMERLPVIDGSLLGWIDAMAKLRSLAAARVVPGHGPHSAPWPLALDNQYRYLTLLRDQIRRVLRNNGTLEQAVKTVGEEEHGNWRLFAEYHARNVTTAFAELEWE